MYLSAAAPHDTWTGSKAIRLRRHHHSTDGVRESVTPAAAQLTGLKYTLSYAGNEVTRHAQGNDTAFSPMGNGRRDSHGGGREILSNLFSSAPRAEANPRRRYSDNQDGGFGRKGREGCGALRGRQSAHRSVLH